MTENAKALFESIKNQVLTGQSKTGSFSLNDLKELSGFQDNLLIETIEELAKHKKVTVLYSDNKPTIISLSNRQFAVTYK